MKRRHLITTTAIAALIVTAGCGGMPDGVLDKEEMASLIVDIHKGEAAIDLSNGGMMSDSMRQVVRRSVYEAHGVTEADVDSSYVYYGHHIEDYLEIYDMVIEQLHTQLENSEAVTTLTASNSVMGDSVNIWPYAQRIKLGPGAPARLLTWELTRDDSWTDGETFNWGFKVLNSETPVHVRMLADYADGTIEWIDGRSSSDGSWMTMAYTLDTVSKPLRIYGIAEITGSDKEYVYLDSIMLTRTHPDSQFKTIRYRYKRFKP